MFSRASLHHILLFLALFITGSQQARTGLAFQNRQRANLQYNNDGQANAMLPAGMAPAPAQPQHPHVPRARGPLAYRQVQAALPVQIQPQGQNNHRDTA